MDYIKEPPEFIVMPPPERILAEDSDLILSAAILMDVFDVAATNDLAYIHEKIPGAMTIEESRQFRKVAARLDDSLPTTKEARALKCASNLYLTDIYLLAAMRLVPEKDIVAMIPSVLASTEIADVVERYDMFTTASLIRQAAL